MELLARTVVEGFLMGLHTSLHLGFSLDFAEYRPYYPGDDIRRIDWKAFGRSDRLYVKRYRGETTTSCYIMLDISPSMSYGSGKITKLEYGQYLAASLAYLVAMQLDAVGYVTLDQKLVEYIPAKSRRGHLHLILSTIERAKTGSATRLEKPLHDLADLVYKRGLIVLISDLCDEPETVLNGLKHFRFNGHDVIVFHVLDDYEVKFPFDKAALFTDMETGAEMHVQPEMLRAEYTAAMQKHIDLYSRECVNANIDYVLLRTSVPLDFALYSYLVRRSKHG
jgi:uncharacterized protein (DUF58 family)